MTSLLSEPTQQKVAYKTVVATPGRKHSARSFRVQCRASVSQELFRTADSLYNRICRPAPASRGGTKARGIGRRVDMDDSVGGWPACGRRDEYVGATPES
jgi:hypothetical protein